MILKFFRDFLNDRKSIKYQIINDESSFNLAVKKLHSFRRISLDTEFMWRKTYFPILSLIQIKLGSKIFIFDCMKLNNLNPLSEILEDDKILKIIHSSRSDSNVLFMSKHIRIKGTFDIQAAENILDKDTENKSYKSLVEKYCNKTLSKSETSSDWSIRPLSREQLDYASLDVIFLENIFKKQTKLLKNINQVDKVFNMSENLTKSGQKDVIDLRLNRYINKHPSVTRLEKNIFIWREKLAQELNIPPSQIIEENKIKSFRKYTLFDDLQYLFKKDEYFDELKHYLEK